MSNENKRVIRLAAEFVETGLGLLQVAGVEAFGEAGLERGEKVRCF
jgi:hypothetical protein